MIYEFFPARRKKDHFIEKPLSKIFAIVQISNAPPKPETIVGIPNSNSLPE